MLRHSGSRVCVERHPRGAVRERIRVSVTKRETGQILALHPPRERLARTQQRLHRDLQRVAMAHNTRTNRVARLAVRTTDMHLAVGRQLHLIALLVDTRHGDSATRRLSAGLKREIASHTHRTGQTKGHANHTVTATAHNHRHEIGAGHPDHAHPAADRHEPHIPPAVALDAPSTRSAAQHRPDPGRCRARSRCGPNCTTAPRKHGQRRDRPQNHNNGPIRDSRPHTRSLASTPTTHPERHQPVQWGELMTSGRSQTGDENAPTSARSSRSPCFPATARVRGFPNQISGSPRMAALAAGRSVGT